MKTLADTAKERNGAEVLYEILSNTEVEASWFVTYSTKIIVHETHTDPTNRVVFIFYGNYQLHIHKI